MGCGASIDDSDEPTTVVVFGATGLLGMAVSKALLSDPFRFKVKCVTRNLSSDATSELAEHGAVIVQANMDEPKTLQKALTGADVMFLTTHYWEDKNKQKEIVRGLNAVDAAVNCGVNHIIFNGSENVKKIIGKDCGHLDSKFSIEEYIREVEPRTEEGGRCPLPGDPSHPIRTRSRLVLKEQGQSAMQEVQNFDKNVNDENTDNTKEPNEQIPETGINFTILRLPFWFENFTTVFRPHKIKYGVYALALPLEDGVLDAISVDDVGECVYKILCRPKSYYGKTVGLCAERLTMKNIVDTFNKHFDNRKFIDPKIRLKDYGNFDFPGAQELAAMFEFYVNGICVRDVKLTKRLHSKLKTFDAWMEDYKDVIEETIKNADDEKNNCEELD